MNRLLQTLLLAVFLILTHAVWRPANAATCEGLDCAQCEADLNAALITSLVTGGNYLFVCGHEAGGNLFVGFGFVGGTPNEIVADYDSFDNSCSVYNSGSNQQNWPTTQMDRQSINAWKKTLREVCRNY